MKVPPNVHEPCLCRMVLHFPGGFMSEYICPGASQFPNISGCQNINASISSRVTGPHFLCACFVQLQLAGYGTYWFRPHIIGKQCIKNVPSRLSAGYLCAVQGDGSANGLSAGTT